MTYFCILHVAFEVSIGTACRGTQTCQTEGMLSFKDKNTQNKGKATLTGYC